MVHSCSGSQRRKQRILGDGGRYCGYYLQKRRCKHSPPCRRFKKCRSSCVRKCQRRRKCTRRCRRKNGCAAKRKSKCRRVCAKTICAQAKTRAAKRVCRRGCKRMCRTQRRRLKIACRQSCANRTCRKKCYRGKKAPRASKSPSAVLELPSAIFKTLVKYGQLSGVVIAYNAKLKQANVVKRAVQQAARRKPGFLFLLQDVSDKRNAQLLCEFYAQVCGR